MTEWTKFAVALLAAVLVFAIGVLLPAEPAASMLYVALMLLGLWWEAPVRTFLLAVSASLAIGATAWFGDGLPTLFPDRLAATLVEVWLAAGAIAWRQQVDGRLRRHARLVGSLLDNAPAPMFIRDREGRHLLVNAAFREIRGLSEGAAEGRSPREFVSEARADVMLASDRRVLETAQPLRRETVEILPNGDRIDRLVVRFPIRDQAGAVMAVGGVATDISEQRRAERSLRESEAMFRAFLGHMPGMLNLKDADGRFLMVNRAMEDRFGLPSAEFIGKTLEQVMPLRPGNATIEAEEQRVLGTGEPSTFEVEMPNRNGVRAIHLISKFPVTDPDGRLLGIGSVGFDISDRRAAEEALRQSEANYRSLVDGAHVGILIHQNMRLIYVNKALASMFGFDDPAAVLGVASFLGLMAPDERQRVHRLLMRSSGGQGSPIEVECRRQDGSSLWVEVSEHPVTWQGQPRQAILVLDKSQARRAELRLREAIDSLADAFVLFDAADRVVIWNAAFEASCREWGCVPSSGTSYEDHMRAGVDKGRVPRLLPDGRTWLDARMAWHANPREPFEYQLTDGRWLQISERRTADGATVLFRRDISDAMQREAELRQAQKMEAIGQLTGGVAHDFNNLLSVIVGNLELAGDGLRPGTPTARFIGNAVAATRRGAALTQRLLAFSRKQPLEPRTVDAHSLVLGMSELLQRTLGEPIELQVVGDGGLWMCRIDPAQLENAVLNLAINARDAMPRGGKLLIETSNAYLDEDYAAVHAEVRPGQYVLVAATDTGVGMSADVRRRVFEPFFTTKGAGHGSGLGLSMVYGFVKQSGGHVSIYSEVDHGTTIKMYLPREPGRADPLPEPDEHSVIMGRGETVLVVEDDADVRALVVNMLLDLGYEVIEAGSGREAMARVYGTQRIDLLLTDIVLPGGMNGRELAQVAERRRRGLPTLFMSGYTENAMIHHGRLDEGVSLLQKPFRRRDLARKVRQVIDEGRRPAEGRPAG